MNKLLIAAIAAIMLPSVALAEVTFQDVTDKMKVGDIRTAEMLTKQILKDKPDSAKAHYYMGQILIAESDYKGARSELKKAVQLDKSLSFAASPDKFRENMDKVEVNLGRTEAPPISNHEESGFGWGKTILFLGLGSLIYLLFKRRKVTPASIYAEPKSQPSHPGANHPAYASTSDRGMQNPYRPSPRPSSYAPAQAAPVVNNYNSGNNGLVDGMILGSMMSGHGNNTNTIIERERVVEREAPAKGNDFDSDSSSNSSGGTFDSGDDSSSRSSGFDSGSDNSSSFDSGGSSFDSGGSSFDSGSSSGD